MAEPNPEQIVEYAPECCPFKQCWFAVDWGGGSSTLNFPGRKTQWKITKHMYVTKGQKFINEKEVVELGVANSTSYRIIPKLRNY